MPLPPAPKHPADRLVLSQNRSKTKRRSSIEATDSMMNPVSPILAPTPTSSTSKTTDFQIDPVAPLPSRLYVLDTNVLLHDPTCLFHFQEHDLFLPMMVLEELDGHKKGMTEVARNARQTSRTLDLLLAGVGAIDQGVDLARASVVTCSLSLGRLYFQTQAMVSSERLQTLPQGKADHQILAVVAALQKERPHQTVILVSKDINMRLKARVLGLKAEDYEKDKTLDDGELLYSGMRGLSSDFWTQAATSLTSWETPDHGHYEMDTQVFETLQPHEPLHLNQFVYYEAAGENPLYAMVEHLEPLRVTLKTLKDYGITSKHTVWGIHSRNKEQNFALNILLNPEIELVTLTGGAGTGKTLMALAAGLTQVLDERRYTEIIMTRATVSMGNDIGFLPGTEEEKMTPWMGALDDNLEFLTQGVAHASHGSHDWGRAATHELIKNRIRIKSMNFMRGRTFLNRYIMVDEAQNLTPQQMKALITRAGPGTKIVCLGNLAQIDTPYLTEGASGLTYLVDRFKGWRHSAHITLARGERSRLADHANETL